MSCTFCSPGTYLGDDGSSPGLHDSADKCLRCDPGSFSNEAETGLTSCAACPSGQVSPAGSGSCNSCPAGYTCADGKVVEVCPQGSYSEGENTRLRSKATTNPNSSATHLTLLFALQAVATVGPAKKVTAVLEVPTVTPAVKDLTSLMPPNPIASHARKARTNKNLLKPCALAARPATSALKGR